MGVTSLLLLSAVSAVLAVPGPQVTTLQGTLRGSYLQSANGNTYAAFQGIPYAKPPVGKNRFKTPEPATPWQGVLIADGTSHDCLQLNRRRIISGDEDCLYINVYTPAPRVSSAQYDVIVDIHGGGFMYGSSKDAGPEYILDYNVTFVSFNYRLGPLGWSQDKTIPTGY